MDWESLRQNISGTLITSKAADFLTHRDAMVWNEIKPDRIPDGIVTVTNEEDVIASIDFARKNNLKVVVHGGGHSWCGLAVRHGGLVIDLSKLNDSTIDGPNKTATIQPVISNRELSRRLQAHDLAFPIGHCPTVKASGYLLNGGMSWNMSQWGPACLSVSAIDFITADGKKIKASIDEHADLFWASKGCGPGMFAVATRFYLNCYTLPKAIMTSTYFYTLDTLQKAVEEVTRLGWDMPAFVELSIFLIQAPPHLAAQCATANGKLCMVSAVAFANTTQEGQAALAVLEKGHMAQTCLSKSLYVASSFEQLSDVSGATWPEKHRNLCENQCSKANPSDILMALRDKIIDAPSAKSVIVFCQSTGQQALLKSSPDTALSLEGRSYGGCWSIWENEKDDAINTTWHNEVCAILKPFTDKSYIGETDIVEDNTRVHTSFTPDKWKRLELIRKKYDPDGLFFGYLGGT